ncbi:MAG: hypothetical protein EAX96_02730 [Candidatus Lokiarchaeota archaeon]|nr:hypothetical protein [Candidatus Lokiarchaeota archaeon]
MWDSKKMSELKNIIEKIEEIYGKLTTKDNDPEIESQLKSELLNNFSSLLAITKVKEGEFSVDLGKKLENVKNLLLSWDPLDNWFKELKDLVNGTFDLLTAAKSLNYKDIIFDKKMVSNDLFQKEISEIKSAINEIKTELTNIKKSSLRAVIPQQPDLTKPIVKTDSTIKRDIPPPQPFESPMSIPTSKPVEIPKPQQVPKPVSIDIPRPTPKPVPLDMPIETPKPVNLQMPVEIPKPTPKPVHLDTPIEIPKPIPKPVTLESAKTVPTQKRQASKEKLFGLFSQPAEPSSLVEKPVSEQRPISIPKPTTSSFKTIGAPVQQPVAKPVSLPKTASSGFKIIGSATTSPTTPTGTAESIDQDKLYQELITLEGKKYSLERNLRDIKSIFESGALTESQYKSQYNEKLNELKGISQKIDNIREQLD